MGRRLEGKIAVCTAAGQGIGRRVAERFLEEGARVYATDLDAEKLKGLNTLGEVDTAVLDVTDGRAVGSYMKTVDTPDILFNCAGFVHHGTVLDCDDKDWDFSFDLNVTSMHRTISALLPRMLENGGGSIINMSSAASSIKAAPNRYVYMTTKAAVIGLTRSIAIDFIRKGIRCNAICPGTIESPSLEARISALGEEVGGVEKARAMFVERQPIGRIGTPDEIADLAVYLGSDESRFTTGTTQVIDGGWSL
ncbi:SDR family oxidoreductase [Afifella marina]|uniref:2-keto-3-deoxy-L-fuconate dehydrogenase n=1 Tax=Afifella marina DSM 2698 TaxID=1120955 RepID=A0A1G5MZG8_AFIMA|nr:SDR family oxidoreductase [Afifella marina]MBK1622137.1 NAD(P)-dependent oxidoreductase [Afifella marina DSM 2698]MBK1628263.1 NAD(P)-dependent oxidoreductase [Afifella marina]MBK5918921.1 NAD(P)-dependent oxidoreductase [Afifella marina]RAI17782.1 NAD(P)-dependent oxidoreductase [Afifella marina DSM 2698]SCZ29820.1 2-keto-3-deoxy-L-fuconate dehydrogenase [Afifella marina DSM 2698]